MKNVIIIISLISAAIICFVLITSYAKEQNIDLKYEKADYTSPEYNDIQFELYTLPPETKSFWEQVAALNTTAPEYAAVTDEEGNPVTDEEGNQVTELLNPPVTDISDENSEEISDEKNTDFTEIPSDSAEFQESTLR